jgi:outer membrane protein OmpA-like peptidoglycan-associated protein
MPVFLPRSIALMIPFNRLLLCAALFFATPAMAQDDDEKTASSGCAPVDNKNAEKLFEKAKDKKKYDFSERMGFLQEALQEEPTYAEANLEMGVMLMRKAKADDHPDDYPAALKYLKAAVEACPQISAEPYWWIGKQYYLTDKYAECIPYLEKYIKFDDDDNKKYGKDYEFNSGQAKEMLRWAKFYVDVKAHPRPFSPKPVLNISTQRDEYLAIITPDNTLAFYIRTMPYNKRDQVWSTDKVVEVFTMSTRQKNGEFDGGTMMTDPFNKNANEGGPTLTIDNKHLYYTITKDGMNGANTDIYTSDFIDGEWKEIRPIGEKVNDPIYWDSQPTISADGRILYFASNRPGGQGGIDIWLTRKNANGEWGVPENLGPTINTAGDEKSPFIHSDSETLYFSSTGHPGIGGFDIFFARKDEKNNWKEPVNIGIPINTEGDDLGLFVSTDAQTAFFCSNSSLPGQVGMYDVYQFELYAEARPEKVAIVKGEMKTAEGTPVTGPVTVEIKNITTKEKTTAVVDTANGGYVAALKVSKKDDYLITVKKDGAAFSSQLVSGKQEFATTTTPVPEMEVKPTKVGEAYTLNNINFATGSAVIQPESMVVLESFAEYLKANPGIKIEIRGHTDNQGDDNQNLNLSNERAYAVFEALTEKFGVSRNQISGAKGYGETMPVADNATENGRAKNRRTEFYITAK